MAKVLDIDEMKSRVARRLSDHRLTQGAGARGTLAIDLVRGVSRTYKHHWTGYTIVNPDTTMTLRAELSDGSFWVEGYISTTSQASWVLAFRHTAPKDRGTGGPRPDDKFANPQAIAADQAYKEQMLRTGHRKQEELIRAEDFDDPYEAVDQFFNYTAWYVLKAVDASWADFGYSAGAGLGWGAGETTVAAMPIDTAIDEGLKKSDIIWVTVDTDPAQKAVPCWFLYTKDKRLFVLSAERQQVIPNALTARHARIVTRWKGRDASLAEFDASVRAITARDKTEFQQVAEQLVSKRQGVQGSVDENVERWMSEGVILELIPRS
ncbi:MAG: hypothetical protein ABR507_05580 [Actinomycetota bacterium]|nr:hypothetical protein [Actinomycetota bacterium]